MFVIEVPKPSCSLLVGLKGRNISMISHRCGAWLNLDNQTLTVRQWRKNFDEDLTRRMIYSACHGGIVRWFTLPSVTDTYYPFHQRDKLEKLALDTFQCKLELFRSKRGHLCLMLVPNKVEGEVTQLQLQKGREAILELLEQNCQP